MAKRYSEHRALNIFSFEAEKWEYPLHKHNFFELIFIEKGSGLHIVNGITAPYDPQSCFLMTPDDEHEFIIEETTLFSYIKFTEILLQERADAVWQKRMKTALQHFNFMGQEIIGEENDRSKMFVLLRLMQQEYRENKLSNRLILLDLFSAMLLIINRNSIIRDVAGKKITTATGDKIHAILAYLREHLTDKEKTSIENLAVVFGLSPTYVSEFFKKHTGESLQQFLIQSKLKIAERLLKQSDSSITEIANTLAFNDVSHFNKVFSGRHQLSPKAYRKNSQNR